ncbi:hypothetical protein C482_19981 [Natrialba chahannaoensis JCM 10990]|uniref:Uncharacterized protein n=1 Tax=Natrialba chahannaoensis JCM 10990 TaxID=1227492 RepID=M0A3V4_9EURY|nr:hypothetical protein C482_19981 [Natrialba chahannaoensis JCM 10990]
MPDEAPVMMTTCSETGRSSGFMLFLVATCLSDSLVQHPSLATLRSTLRVAIMMEVLPMSVVEFSRQLYRSRSLVISSMTPIQPI